MKKNLKFIKKIKNFSILLIFLLVFLFQSDNAVINALPMNYQQSGLVVEELRLKVPAEFTSVNPTFDINGIAIYHLIFNSFYKSKYTSILIYCYCKRC